MVLYRFLLWLLLRPALAIRSRWVRLTRAGLPGATRERWLLDRPAAGPAPRLWLHAASNGELASARPLIRALLAADPALRLVVTCNTLSGRALVAGWAEPRVEARLAPHDLRPLVGRFLDIWHPAALVVVENELWPERLVTAAARGVPVLAVAARMSERSYRLWSRLPGIAAPVMEAIRWLAPQDDASRTRFATLGLPEDRIGPAMVLKSAAAPAGAPPLPFPRGATLLAASTHEGEEAVVLAAFARARAARPDLHLHLILAPRHARRRDEVEAAIRAAGLGFSTRSRGAEPDPATPVYLADTLGEMDRWYAGAGITFVGGSLVARGGHTPFEPAAHGSAILTGPHVANAAPAYAALLSGGGAVQVTDAESLARAVLRLSDPEVGRAQAEAARRALAPFTADAAIAAFLAALVRETGLPLSGAPDARHP